MCFDIVSTISADYIHGVPLFVPSWFRNSGASQVRIYIGQAKTFYESIIERNANLMDAVLNANGVPILALDLDCFIVKSVAGGFDGKHPIAVARWPAVNMGVVFFDTRIKFDWKGFFVPLVERITSRCRDPRTWGNKDMKGRFGDQYDWMDSLKMAEEHVRKLDMNEWNFCHQPEDWEVAMNLHHKSIRIVHIKGRGDWHLERYQKKLRLTRDTFPDAIKE